jgi:hypothetical protein
MIGVVAKKLIAGILGLFGLVGAGGFFGAALSAMELLKHSTSFDWPVAGRYPGPNTKLGISVTAV